MVKTLRPRNSQDLWVPGLVWMMIGLPRGAKGAASKFKGPLKCSQADRAGSMLDWRRIFRVISVCWWSLSQGKLGNVLDNPARIDRKLALKVCIIHLAALRWSMSGGMSWKVELQFSSICSL